MMFFCYKQMAEFELFAWGCNLVLHSIEVPVIESLCYLCVSQDYIAVKEKYSTYLPHTAGRYAAKRFRKAQVCDFHQNYAYS